MNGAAGLPAALATALARALAEPAGLPLAAAIPMPAQTALVLDPVLGDAAAALGPLAAALARQGIPRGRLDVIVASCGDAGAERACALAARAALAPGPVHVRDPEHGDHYPAGELDGETLEIDDVLREAEAVIVVVAGRAGVPPWSVLVPGLVSARCARRIAARAGAPPSREAVLAFVRVDWVVEFEASRVRAGTPALLWNAAHAS